MQFPPDNTTPCTLMCKINNRASNVRQHYQRKGDGELMCDEKNDYKIRAHAEYTIGQCFYQRALITVMYHKFIFFY